jgi:molecular chaperone DnaK
VDLLNQTDSLIFQTEKQMTEVNEKLTAEEKTLLTEKVEVVKKAKVEKNIEAIKTSTGELQQTWHQISERLYKQDQANQQTSQSTTEEGPTVNVDSNPTKDDIQDIPYEEIK